MLARLSDAARDAARRPIVLAGTAAAVALLWVQWPTLTGVAERWGRDPQYSHGYLVPLFSLFLLWHRRDCFPSGPARSSWWGLALLAAGLMMRLTAAYFYFPWLAPLSLLPCVAGLAVLVGGWSALRWSWPAVAFLAFMLPLPYQLEIALAHPLQRVATLTSTYALQTLGFAAFAEGNVIRMGQVRIGVVEACSGLSMLLVFLALATAVAVLVRRPWPERVVLLVSALPVALVANILRITVTGVLYKTAGKELADLVFHDLAGWLMMPLALVLLAAELRLIAWVVPSAEPGPGPRSEKSPPAADLFRGPGEHAHTRSRGHVRGQRQPTLVG
jgi:exosortase